MSRAGKRWLALVLFALLSLAAMLGVAWFRPFGHYGDSPKFIVVPRGMSSHQVAHLLQQEGVVRHWSAFLLYLKTVKRNAHLQAGEYKFDAPQSVVQVVDKLVRGLVYYHELIIPEGYSLFEIAELLEQKGFSTSTEFWAAASRSERVSPFAAGVKNLEGFLFPDTYRLVRGTTADEIVGMMVDRFREVYTQSLEVEMKQSRLSFSELLTLASLIEKETGVDAERDLISAVFHNRLKRRMPLQCDPTVIYAARLRGKYRGTIFQSDLNLESPYNTYRRLGLPPGPIANPGKRSIEAAIKPAKVDYLYFVANHQGGHTFSNTLEDHQRAVAAYRKGLNHNASPGSV
jgi:UPF0755 protein